MLAGKAGSPMGNTILPVTRWAEYEPPNVRAAPSA